MPVHFGVLILAAMCAVTGCAPAGGTSADTEGANTDAISGKAPKQEAGTLYGTILGFDGQPVPDGVVADFTFGDYTQSILTDSSGSYALRPDAVGRGTLTVYFGVLPDYGPDPISLSTWVFASTNSLRFSCEITIDSNGGLALHQF